MDVSSPSAAAPPAPASAARPSSSAPAPVSAARPSAAASPAPVSAARPSGSTNPLVPIRPPFDSLFAQPLVARFLSSVMDGRHASHAYLFSGPIGAGKTEAARAFAKALICRDRGCGACDDCIRVAKGVHPDVKVIEPEGAAGYVSEQMRELIHDANLSPVRARGKVYIVTRVDLLKGAPANAFLKTLEEPPGEVTFILLTRTRESMLETLVSRCQVIAFRYVSEEQAVPLLMQESGVTLREARVALATTGGSVYRAREFLGSPSRCDARLKVLETIERLPRADSLDVLESARELLISLKQPLDELKLEQERQLVEGREYLGKGALTALEQRQKRSLTNREREAMGEALSALRSWLRDCLLARIGRGDDLVNSDFYYNILKVAETADEAALARAITAVDEAERQIHYNVSVQSVIEALLFTVRDELRRTG